MGQTSSVPTRGRRKSLRSFRSPFPRRTNSHQGSLSAAFTIPENDLKPDLLNINTASEEELMTLPGITRKIAQNIVEYRRVIGRFKKVEDLALVSEIGAEKLHKIKSEICVGKRKLTSCSSSRAQSLDSLKSSDSSRYGLRGSQKLIDVNKGNCFDFMSLHGMTQELAANIIHYRDKKGPFTSIDGLLKVKGIDSIKLGNIRSQLTINSSSEQDLSTSILKAKNELTSPLTELNINSQNHTPCHRKSLSAPIKFSLSLGNGLSKAPIDDIFDLLSVYSYRPIVEEDFRYERNGKRAVRIATWNLDRLCSEKAENLGFREVVCRTILENRFSVIAIQDVYDVVALKLICDELNKPTLRRVFEWKDNSREWNYCFSDAHCMLSENCAGIGFIYDCQSDIDIEFLSIKELPLATLNGKKSEAAIGRFRIGDVKLSLLNMCLHPGADLNGIEEQVKKCMEDTEDYFIMLGDFSEYHKQINNLINSTFTYVVPLSTNTSSMSVNPHHSLTLRYSDNIFLSPSASSIYAEVGSVVRQGLTHMAIPRGWSWGGPASEHCPVWCEIYTDDSVTQEVTNDVQKPLTNGNCVNISNDIVEEKIKNGKCVFDI